MSRYVSVATRIWHDEKFRKLPEDARMLFVYLLSSPHSNMCGLYFLPPGYACHDLQWTEERYGAAMAQLQQCEIVIVDGDIILIKNFIKYNPIRGPKQAVGAANRLKEVPENKLIKHFLNCLEHSTTKDDYAKFIDTYGTNNRYPIDTLSIPDSDTDSDSESDTESKTPPPDKKTQYAEYVKMTTDQHAKLTDRFGPGPTERMIEILDSYKGAKGKQYKCDYRAILNWVVKRYEEEGGQHNGSNTQTSTDDHRYEHLYE